MNGPDIIGSRKLRMIEQLCQLADIWAVASDRSVARLATIVLNRGHFFETLRSGGDCGTETFEKFLTFFRDGSNWPAQRVPQDAVDLLDNFENIAVAAAASTGKVAAESGEGIAA